MESPVSEQKNDKIQKLSIVHTFAVQFSFAIQTTLITALLVEYAMESILDSFVWIIPNILIIILKPYYTQYLNQRNNSSITILNNSLVCLFISGIGSIIVMLSTYPQYFVHTTYWWFYHFLRIIFSAIGWTCMDVGLTFVSINRDKLVEQIEDQKIQKQLTKTQYLAKILAFALAFHACTKSPSWNNFHVIVDILYLTSAFVSFSAAAYTLYSSKFTNLLHSLNPLTLIKTIFSSIRKIRINKDTFFPGAKYVLKAPLQIKSYFITKFCVGYTTNIIMIYSCMWFVWAIGEHEQDLTSSILITGLRFGAFFLGLFSINQFLIKKLCSNFSLYEFVFVDLIANIFAITNMSIVSTSFVVIFGSVSKATNDLYFTKLAPHLSSICQQYDSCLQFIQTIEGLVTLSAMPFFWMIIMDDDDTNKCLVGSVLELIVMLILALLRWKRSQKQKTL